MRHKTDLERIQDGEYLPPMGANDTILAKIRRFLKPTKKYGLDIDNIKIKAEDFIFGDGQLDDRFGGDEIIRPDGQWDNDLPQREIQAFPWGESWACTVFGTENTLQILMKAKYGIEEEYTERYHSAIVGIRESYGGNPHDTSESIRKNGQLPYSLLPFEGVRSFEEFNSPKPMTAGHLARGRQWLDTWQYGHDWLGNFSASNIKEALKRSPLGAGVCAWYFDSGRGVYYKPTGRKDNHWVTIFGYVDGQYWKVFDHYDSLIKHLDWNYPFAFMKRYTLNKKDIGENEAGRILYVRFKGKHIIVPEDGGAIYFIGDTIDFEGWWTNSDWLQGGINKFLREQEKLGNFTGITKANFDLLTKYAITVGVNVEESSKNTINQLKAKL